MPKNFASGPGYPRLLGRYTGVLLPQTATKSSISLVLVQPKNKLAEYSATNHATSCEVGPGPLGEYDSLLKRPHSVIPLVNPAIFSHAEEREEEEEMGVFQQLLGRLK